MCWSILRLASLCLALISVIFFPHFSGDGIEEGVRQGEWLVVVVTMLSIIAEELADERPGGEEGHGMCHGPMVLCGSHAHSSHWDGQLCLSPQPQAALKKWRNSDKQAMTVTSLTNNTPPGAKLHTKFVACEIKKNHCTLYIFIAHFHCTLHIFIANCCIEE